MWKVATVVVLVALLGTSAFFFYQGYEARARLEPVVKVKLNKVPMQPAPPTTGF